MPVKRLFAWLRLGLLALGAATVVATPARAQVPVDLQLVLAVDVSGSVSDERFLLQQRGYAAAFRTEQLLEAIRSGRKQSIAVTMTQWTGPTQQMQVVAWMLLTDQASMHAFADAIERASRQMFGGGTSISGAIDHAMALFPESGFASQRRVIDISGDGANNRGRPAAEARDAAVRAVEQARVEVLLQLADLERHRRLRHEQRLGGLGEGEVLCDGVEYLEATVCHDSTRRSE